MANIGLIITIVITLIILIGVSMLFVFKFSNRDDKNGIAPKIMAIASLSLSIFSVLIIPIDVANTSDNGGINIKILWETILSLIIILFLVVIPFSYIFFSPIVAYAFEGMLFKRILYGLFGSLIAVVVFAVIAVPLYFTSNSAKLNFPIYMLAVFTLIAWFPFSLFTGVGLISLSFGLFNE